jgi:hypothetical protein
MIEATLTFGFIIFAGMAFILWKLPLKTRLWLLGHDMMLDIVVSAIVLWIHWGTMTGLMAATVAGLLCAVCTGAAKRLWGYKHKGVYIRGILS